MQFDSATNALTSVDAAVAAAAEAAPQWAASTASARARFLRSLADGLDAHRDALVPIAQDETGLPLARLNGEVARTSFQLRGFANEVEAGAPFAVLDDPAVPEAPPQGRPHLVRTRVPLGPVAMFSASNFPFAFSVLGGDTASALAAGCPVVVKAHPAHPLLSRAVIALATDLLQEQGLPAGVLSMLQGGIDMGVELVRHPGIRAVAFTGSHQGGVALQREANARDVPIPFYGELGSINPVVILPAALRERVEEQAGALASSIVSGTGQFCTSPGVVLLPQADPATPVFVQALNDALAAQDTHRMLTPSIRSGFQSATGRMASLPGVRQVSEGPGSQPAPRPVLMEVSAQAFATDARLREEMFGPACLVVRTGDVHDVLRTLQAVGGALTVTLWGADEADADTQAIVRGAVSIAGRVLFAGVPTGVAVTRAQQHGGPWPASTRAESTSVGCLAMDRFLRPVALQDAPPWLLERNGVPL